MASPVSASLTYQSASAFHKVAGVVLLRDDDAALLQLRDDIECREGQALQFILRARVENLPRRDYLTRVWDLGLAARANSPL